MKGEVLTFCVILIVGEAVSVGPFYLINRSFNQGQKGVSIQSIIKGNVERLFLFLLLVNSLPQSFIVFGALKIATRLKDQSDKISNDYFLIGNLVSLILSIAYYLIYKQGIN